MKCLKSAKNAHLNIPEFKVTSSNCFFRQTNSPKQKGSSFMVINDKEKQKIFTFKRLNQEFVLLLYLKNDFNDLSIIKIVGN